MVEFLIITGLAFVLSFIPIIRVPFNIIETFFHELSHGLMAILTFGKIHSLKISSDGSGLCTTSGGFRPFILFSGYIGASSAGYIIYYTGANVTNDMASDILYGLMIFSIFVTLLWVRNITTLLCMIMIGIVFYFPLMSTEILFTAYYLKFIGIYVCLNAIKAPLHLIDGKSEGDGADLFKYTLMPEFVWITVWFIYGIYALYNIYLITAPKLF